MKKVTSSQRDVDLWTHEVRQYIIVLGEIDIHPEGEWLIIDSGIHEYKVLATDAQPLNRFSSIPITILSVKELELITPWQLPLQ